MILFVNASGISAGDVASFIADAFTEPIDASEVEAVRRDVEAIVDAAYDRQGGCRAALDTARRCAGLSAYRDAEPKTDGEWLGQFSWAVGCSCGPGDAAVWPVRGRISDADRTLVRRGLARLSALPSSATCDADQPPGDRSAVTVHCSGATVDADDRPQWLVVTGPECGVERLAFAVLATRVFESLDDLRPVFMLEGGDPGGSHGAAISRVLRRGIGVDDARRTLTEFAASSAPRPLAPDELERTLGANVEPGRVKVTSPGVYVSWCDAGVEDAVTDGTLREQVVSIMSARASEWFAAHRISVVCCDH